MSNEQLLRERALRLANLVGGAVAEVLRKLCAALAQPAEGGEVCHVKSSAGLIRPGEVDAWVANHYTNPPASQEQAQQPSGPHPFEFWWEAHMPQATQAEAWAAWQAAHSSKGVGIEQQPKPQPITVDEVAERLAEFPLLHGIASVDIHELMFLIRMVEAHHGITAQAKKE